MYAALWRVLPGPLWLKIVQSVALFLIVVAVLFTWVFPWVESVLTPQDVTVVPGSSS